MNSIREGVGWVLKPEKKPTANRRTRKPSVCSPLRTCSPRLNPASLWLAPRIGFAFPHLNSAGLIANQRFAQLRASLSAHPARPAGSSLIGTVRANPVAAPAAPVRERFLNMKNILFTVNHDIRSRSTSIIGGAGAPTGFARTIPMKGRAVVAERHDERE